METMPTGHVAGAGGVLALATATGGVGEDDALGAGFAAEEPPCVTKNAATAPTRRAPPASATSTPACDLDARFD
jgi:hypothetical protein